MSRNPVARSLSDPKYRPRVVPVCTNYRRPEQRVVVSDDAEESDDDSEVLIDE